MAVSDSCQLLLFLLSAVCLTVSQGISSKYTIPEINVENNYKSITSEELLYPSDVEEISAGPIMSKRRNLDSSWFLPTAPVQNVYASVQQYQPMYQQQSSQFQPPPFQSFQPYQPTQPYQLSLQQIYQQPQQLTYQPQLQQQLYQAQPQQQTLQQPYMQQPPVQQPIPQPFPVQQPVPQPFPVQQPVPQPISVQAPAPQTLSVQQQVPQPLPVQQPIPQPLPVQQPVLQTLPVPQPVPQALPVQQPLPSQEQMQPPPPPPPQVVQAQPLVVSASQPQQLVQPPVQLPQPLQAPAQPTVPSTWPLESRSEKQFPLPSQATSPGPQPTASDLFGRSTTHPSQIERFKKYFPETVISPPTVAPQAPRTLSSAPATDLFGRATTHPSQIARFQKYFNLPNLLETVPAPTVLQATASPATTVSTTTTSTTSTQPSSTTTPTKTPTTLKPTTVIPIFPGLSGFAGIGGLNLPNLDDRQISVSKCDNKTNFSFAGKNYLATFLTPQCPNMTWSESSDFCQTRGLSLISPGSSESSDALLKLGAMMKQGAGVWTDGYVAHPTNTKIPNNVLWTSIAVTPVAVVSGDGLFSPTGEDGKPQPDNFLFRQTGKIENVEHCVALFNNRNKDGVKLHDQACNVRLPVICQTTPSTLNLSTMLNPIRKLQLV